jgi:peptide chain release factor 2
VWSPLGGTFDYADKKDRLTEVLRELEDPDIWNDPGKAQGLGKERVLLEGIVNNLDGLTAGLTDAGDLLEMAMDEGDADTVDAVAGDVAGFERQVQELEFRRMFAGETDANNAFVDVQAGSGGTEAQDWAEMLLRMYLRWGEAHTFKTELMEVSPGEVAGIKSATIRFEGPMPSAGSERKPASIVWCASRPSIPATAATRRSRPSSCPRRSTIPSRSRSTRRI